MGEEVYDFLRAMGFTKEEVNMFEDENEDMYFTNLIEVNKNIAFLMGKGLSKEEVMDVFRVDPFMITVKNNRLEAFDKIYLQDLSMPPESLKKIIVMNPDTYIASVSALKQNIDYLKSLDYSVEDVRDFLINNPQTVSMSPEEFQNVVEQVQNDGDRCILGFDEAYILDLQQKYKNDEISEDDMTSEELDALHLLYQRQIKELRETLKQKLARK